MQIKDIMTKDVVSVDKDERLQQVLRLMRKHTISKLPVVDEGELVGVIADGHIADELGALKNAGIPASSLHASSAMAREFHTLSPYDDVAGLVERFQEDGGLGLFPVVNGTSLLGVVTKADILGLVTEGTPLRDIMVTELHAVKPQDRVIHARRIMIDHGVERLPVIDDGRVVGIVAETDVAYGFEQFKKQVPKNHQENQLDQFLVEDIMTRRVVTAPPDMPAEEAAARMREEDVGCLPVVDAAGTVQGMVTRTDLIRSL